MHILYYLLARDGYLAVRYESDMHVVRIEHPVQSFDAWRKAFDDDPVGREASGVRRYRVFRPVDDPKYVMIDLDFDGMAEAEAFLVKMRAVWSRVAGTLISTPSARIVDVIESKEYDPRAGESTS